MSKSLDERTLVTLENLLPAYNDFPYLCTRVVTALYHIIPLPATVDEATLRTFARYQLACNQLPTCLVLGPRTSIFINPYGLEPYGLEEISNCIPRGGIVVAGKLAPWAGIEQTDWWEAKSNRLKAAVPFLHHTVRKKSGDRCSPKANASSRRLPTNPFRVRLAEERPKPAIS